MARTVHAVLVAQVVVATIATAQAAPHLDSATAAEVDRIVARAAAAGLPAFPIRAKALEGASRGASDERIVRVVEAEAAALAQGRDAIGPRASEAELTAAAGAIGAGVSPGALGALVVAASQARPATPVTVVLVVTTDLIARGVPADSAAAAAVNRAATHHATDPELWALRQQIARDIDLGVAPVQAATLRTVGWGSGAPVGAPAPPPSPPLRPLASPSGPSVADPP